MQDNFICDETFENKDYALSPLPDAEYESCIFKNCNFADGNLNGVIFNECTFTGCDLSLVKVDNTAFREASFQQCKMLGIHFHKCLKPGLELNFDECILNHSSFYSLSLPKTNFNNCRLLECDFASCNLNASKFPDCDLSGCTFDQTKLEKCDFSSARNFQIDPESNNIKNAVFALEGLPGLLAKYKIKLA